MVFEKVRSLTVSLVAAAIVMILGGCSGGDDGPSAPQLGEEIDLSPYQPASWEDYLLTYRSMTTVDTVETDYWHHGTAVVYDQDAEPGEQSEVDCHVFQEEADYIFSGLGDVRYFMDLEGQFMYGIKVYGGGTWEPLYYLRPKMRITPDHTPRINEVVDFGASNLIFTYEDDGYRASIWMRTWTTYLAVEESVTVPAGTFQDVLRTRDRQRMAIKVTAINDTTNVYGTVERSESVADSWSAPGIGSIRVTAGSGQDFIERVLISATVDGVTYPTKAGEAELRDLSAMARAYLPENDPAHPLVWLRLVRSGSWRLTHI